MDFLFKKQKVSYERNGHGVVVVLLHGFGENKTIWNKQVDALSGICTLIIPDLPGSGTSSLLEEDAGDVSIELFAEVIFGLLQHEKVDQCILVGHSMGGYIALAFAEKYAGMLLGLGLVHSTAFADSDEKKITRQKGIELIRSYGGYSFLKNTIPNLFGSAFKKENPESIEALIQQANQFSDTALIQYYTAMKNRPNRTSVLQNTKVPVLFIAGNDDVAAPLDDLLQQVHLPAVSHIHIIEGIGHMGMWEASDAVNRYLTAYISSLD